MLLTYPTMLLFAAGYLLRWQDIPRYWIWCADFPNHNPRLLHSSVGSSCGPLWAGLSLHVVAQQAHCWWVSSSECLLEYGILNALLGDVLLVNL